MNPTLAHAGCVASGASGVAAQATKRPCSACSCARTKFTQRSCPDCRKATLQAMIRGRVALESVIHSDSWRGYDGLVDVGYAKHLRVEHGHNEFGFGTRHPTKGHPTALRAFGASPKNACKSSTVCHLTHATCISLHRKECEWRFNQRHHNLYLQRLKLLQKNPI